MEHLIENWERAKELPLTQLDSPLELPFLELGHLFKLLWSLTDSEADPMIRLDEPIERDWKSIEALTAEVDEGLLIGHSETHTRFRALRNMDDMVATLQGLKDGTVVELIGYGSSPTYLHRHLGTIFGETIRIISTYPAMSHEQLAKGVSIANGDNLLLDTPEQAETVVELAQQEWAGTNMVLEADDREVKASINGESEIDLIRHFALRAAFCDGPWSFEDDDDDDGASALAAMNQSFLQSLARIPAGKTPVYQGANLGAYIEDFLSQSHMTQADLDVLDQQLDELGFHPLGNMSALSFYGSVIRGYAKGEQDFGVAYASSHFKYHFDFFCPTENKTVTTSSKVSGPKGNKNAVFSYHPTAELKEMLAAHHQMVEKTGTRLSITPTLTGLAESIADFLANQNSDLF